MQPYEANVATEIIRGFYADGNETVARGTVRVITRLYIVPMKHRILSVWKSLLTLLRNQGVSVQKAGKKSPKGNQEILESIHGLPNEAMISRLTLRTMKQAKIYDAVQRTFWSCSEILLSFTSPIRRYRIYRFTVSFVII